MSNNKANKRKKTLSDWSFILSLVSLGFLLSGVLAALITDVVGLDFIFDASEAAGRFAFGLLETVTIFSLLAAFVSAALSLITGLSGLISWLLKKETPTWKLLAASLLSPACIATVCFLIYQAF